LIIYNLYLGIISQYIELSSQTLPPLPADLIPPPLEINCSDSTLSRFLTGRRQEKRVFDLFGMAQELWTVEARLWELSDSVDLFVIFESTLTHRRALKPLFLSRNIERFQHLRHKIKVVIDDDAANYKYLAINQSKEADWPLINWMRTVIYRKLIEMVELNPEDIIIHGDADEIPLRYYIKHLKHCEIRDDALPLAFSGTFFEFSYNHIYRTGHPLKLPNVFRKEHVEKNKGMLVRIMGVPTLPYPSAVHLNRFGGTLVDVTFKESAMAEGGHFNFRVFNHIEDVISRQFVDPVWEGIRLSKSSPSERNYVPWLTKSFPERFHYFWMNKTEALELIKDVSQHHEDYLPHTKDEYISQKESSQLEIPSSIEFKSSVECNAGFPLYQIVILMFAQTLICIICLKCKKNKSINHFL